MNFRENKPIYIQIAERISDEVMAGKYLADERIPSVREYAMLVEVNVNTVVRSYDYLQSLGVIYNKRGLGYFVSLEAKEIIAKHRRDTLLGEELRHIFSQLATIGVSPEQLSDLYAGYLAKK